jgi:hypothetical protein
VQVALIGVGVAIQDEQRTTHCRAISDPPGDAERPNGLEGLELPGNDTSTTVAASRAHACIQRWSSGFLRKTVIANAILCAVQLRNNRTEKERQCEEKISE